MLRVRAFRLHHADGSRLPRSGRARLPHVQRPHLPSIDRSRLPHVDPRFVIPVTLIALCLFGVGLALGNVIGNDPAGTQTLTFTRSFTEKGVVTTVHGTKTVHVKTPPRVVTRNGKPVTLPGTTVDGPSTVLPGQVITEPVTVVRTHNQTTTVRTTVSVPTTITDTVTVTQTVTISTSTT